MAGRLKPPEIWTNSGRNEFNTSDLCFTIENALTTLCDLIDPEMNSEKADIPNSTNRSALEASEMVHYRLGHRPGLDGLRGAAIILVVAAHIFDLPDASGFIGVNTFFVLSGFLITALLLEEWEESGKISFCFFYARRALRLLPALFFLLLCFLAYCRLNHFRQDFQSDLKEAKAVFFYYYNWAGLWDFKLHNNMLTHAWSLSLEEQYYLLWPPILWLFLKYADRRSLLNFIGLGIFASCLLRCIMVLIDPKPVGDYNRLYVGLDTRADSLLTGCGLAVILSTNLLPAIASQKKTLSWAAAVSMIFLAVTPMAFSVKTKGMYFTGWFFLTLCAGAIVLGLALNSAGVIQSLLENPALMFVGKLSYSLYLWHFPLLCVCHDFRMSKWTTRIFSICTSILMALISYYFIERPCLRLKRHFSGTNNGSPQSGSFSQHPLLN